MTELAKWVQEHLQDGPVPFVQFMEWALYHPEWGYYVRDRKKIGKEGDFYTSPSVHPVFGEVLADEIAKRLEEVGGTQLVEFGAGEGRLARDILNRWRDEHSALYQQVQVRIVEASPSLQEVQRQTLAAHAAQVRWVSEEDLHAAGPFVGVVLTNELVDAFPVHRVTKTAEGFVEQYVTLRRPDATGAEGAGAGSGAGGDVGGDVGDVFTWTTGPLSDEGIAPYLEAYGAEVQVGQTVEVGLPGVRWYERTLGLLTAGVVITIDYGFEAEMLYHPSRLSGTLRGFYRHTVTADPFAHLGEQDLTADVNFTALIRCGEARGWQTDFFHAQSHYLVHCGILTRLTDTFAASLAGADPFHDPDMKRNRAIKSLLLPGGLGDAFKVLVQSMV